MIQYSREKSSVLDGIPKIYWGTRNRRFLILLKFADMAIIIAEKKKLFYLNFIFHKQDRILVK